MIIYIDESIDFGLCCYGALIGTTENLHRLEMAMNSLADELTISGIIPDSGIEFHGHDLFHLKDAWHRLTINQSKTIFQKIAQIGIECNVQVILRATDIKRFKEKYFAFDVRSTTFENLLERVNEFLRTKSSYGLVVADHNYELQKILQDNFQVNRESGTKGYRSQVFTQLIDTVHFVDSNRSRAVQFVDVIAFIWRRYESRLDSHPDAIEALNMLHEYFDVLTPIPHAKYLSIRRDQLQ